MAGKVEVRFKVWIKVMALTILAKNKSIRIVVVFTSLEIGIREVSGLPSSE